MSVSLQDRSLSGARVLLVGASGGIGRPLAAALAGRGAHLALAGRDRSRLDDSASASSRTFAFDLADAAAAQPLVVAAAEALGGLDGVVCCAGAVAFGPLDEIPSDVLHEIVAVDLVGPLMLARAAIPVLPRGGFILNVSGVIAELPTAGLVSYSAAKAGISAGFRALAREVRPRGLSVIDARPPHTETGLAGRAAPRGAAEDARGARPGCGGRATRARDRAGRARRARERFHAVDLRHIACVGDRPPCHLCGAARLAWERGWTDCADGCHGLRRRPPAARARGPWGARSLSLAPAGVPLGARRARHRGRARRRVAPEDAAPCARGGRDGLLPRPFDGVRRLLRGGRSQGGRGVRACRTRRRRAQDRLPRRPRRGRPLRAPLLEARGRADPAHVGGADDRVPRLDRDRLGERVVRDAPRARRAAAGDGHATLGGHAHAADRDRGRARLPPRGARPRAGRRRGVRDRRRRRLLVPRPDARVRRPPRPPPAHDPRAGVDAAALEPLAPSRHPGLRRHRA